MMTDTSPKLSGEPTAQALASGLATLGRYGDNYMVHAAEGETVVPKEILDANPGLKDNLFKQMRMMGIEDPNRYVVGSELNSINPITGQPEFFFKKIFKAIKKVAKKILPVAAPIIGNLIAPGIGGILASGLTTKLTGGSMADAFKSMALSYGAGALGRGIMGATAGGGLSGFTEGLGKGLTQPFSALGNIASSGAANPFSQGIFGSRSLSDIGFFPEYQTPSATPALAGAGLGSQPGIKQLVAGEKANFIRLPETGQMAQFNDAQVNALRQAGALQTTDQGLQLVPDYKARMAAFSPRGGITQSGRGIDIARNTQTLGGQEYYVNPRTLEITRLAEKAADKPGMLNRLGQFVTGDKLTGTPATLAGAGVAGLGLYAGAKMLGLTEDEASVADQLSQLDATNPQRAAYDRWSAIADKNSDEARRLKAIWYRQPQYTAAQLQSSFGANPLQGITPGTPGAPLTAAGGGEVTGPGTGTSDSIPAMLSDGEFVMTAKAVRNAGNGDRDVGAARMYDMMNRFERGMA